MSTHPHKAWPSTHAGFQVGTLPTPNTTSVRIQVPVDATAHPSSLSPPSPQLIPEDYEYSSANDAAYVSRHDGVRIEERAEVRVRIVGVRIDAAELVSRGAPGRRTGAGWGPRGRRGCANAAAGVRKDVAV